MRSTLARAAIAALGSVSAVVQTPTKELVSTVGATTATNMGTYSGNVASRCIDGDLSTYFFSDYAITGKLLTVTLSSYQDIKSIQMVACCRNRNPTVSVHLLLDDGTW